MDIMMMDNMVDRVGIEDINIDNYSDYDSVDSNDIDVKEAIRSSISQKTKHTSSIPSVKLSTSPRDSESDLEAELDLQPRKSKKPKVEDEETASMRRERNRLAAQRCRQRRRDRIDKLELICQRLENDGDKLQVEISDLRKEMDNLQKILSNHKCMAKPVKTEIFMPSRK